MAPLPLLPWRRPCTERETSLFVNPEASLFLNSVRIRISSIYLNLTIRHWHLRTQVPKLKKNLRPDIQSALIIAKTQPFFAKANFVASNNTCQFIFTLFELMSIPLHVNSNSWQFKPTEQLLFSWHYLYWCKIFWLKPTYVNLVGTRRKIKNSDLESSKLNRKLVGLNLNPIFRYRHTIQKLCYTIYFVATKDFERRILTIYEDKSL